jgi:hypothetical protein
MLGTYFLGFGTVSFLYFQANDQIEALGGDNCDIQLGTFMGKNMMGRNKLQFIVAELTLPPC